MEQKLLQRLEALSTLWTPLSGAVCGCCVLTPADGLHSEATLEIRQAP